MALIIEDGSIVAGANSYATVAQIRAYAASRGVTLSATDADVEILAIKAMDWVEAQEERFKGCRRTAAQPLAWPRQGVLLFGGYFDSDSIPAQLIAGQAQAAMDAVSTELLPTLDPAAGSIRREKVGPIETEFFGSIDRRTQPGLTAANAVMAVLFRSGAFSIKVDRV